MVFTHYQICQVTGPSLLLPPTATEGPNLHTNVASPLPQQLLTTKSRETALEHQVKQLKAQMAKLKIKKPKDAAAKDGAKEGEEKEGEGAEKA